MDEDGDLLLTRRSSEFSFQYFTICVSIKKCGFFFFFLGGGGGGGEVLGYDFIFNFWALNKVVPVNSSNI